MPATFERYGCLWPGDCDDLMVEFACIQKGGQWKSKYGDTCGAGLFEHYRRAQSLMWPEDGHHRWSDLILREILSNTITAILGPKDSGKTHGAAKYALTDYFAFPEKTLILISSTDLRGLEMRVWGDVKSLHERAKLLFPELAGNVLESKHAICTDNLEEDEVRDMRKGIICIPCLSSQGQYVGLGRYVGMKQERRRLIADECQFMREGFLDAPANMNSGDFKGIFLGNPLGMDDPLDKVSEPKTGWTSLPEPEKTAVWENRWLNGKTINLVGTDSPNFDPETKDKYTYLINQKSIDNTIAFYTKDSLQYYSQCKGVRRSGINAHRVITREMCEQFGAFDDVIWKGTPITKIAACDAAYGGVGGDRCVAGHIEFGEDIDGKIVIACQPPVIVPVSIKKTERPEDQITQFVMDYCNANEIPPENFFFDATGRGSLGTSLARIWSANTEPIEFGGVPTNRPVSLDFYVLDPKSRERRPKLCNEHYSKFVTELWFTVRYVIEARQLRQLPEDVAREGYMREWILTRGDKIEVEKKSDTKLRMNRSPDCFVEGTMISTVSGETPIQLVKIGDLVLTPFGYSPVVAVHKRHINEECCVKFSNGASLCGKPSHKIFTSDNGWIELDSLSMDNECESIYDRPIWMLLNAWFTRAAPIGFKRLADIIKTRTGKAQAKDFFTESSGRSTMGIFLKGCASIIKTAIGQTTRFQISNLFRSLFTRAFISEIDGILKKEERHLCACSIRDLTLPHDGIKASPAGRGTGKTLFINGDDFVYQSQSGVSSVAIPSSPRFQAEPSTVPFHAEAKITLEKLRMIAGLVWYAARCLLLTSTEQRKPAAVNVRRYVLPEPKSVYNITLADENAYYANGILVENCFDWLVTCVEGARRRGFKISKLANEEESSYARDWLDELSRKQRELIHRRDLVYR